jgi:hypothetical protein
MVRKTIEPIVWETILDNVNTGHCVAFLGAGVNASIDPDPAFDREAYRGLRLGSEVASLLAASFVGTAKDKRLEELVAVDTALEELVAALLDLVNDEDEKQTLGANYRDLFRLRAYDLGRVALHAEAKVGKPSLVQWLQRTLPDESREPSRLLRTLAQLPLRLIVTTNYDRLMEKAFENQPTPLVISQPLNGFEPRERTSMESELGALLPKQVSPRAADERAIIYKIHGTFADVGRGLVVSEDDYVQFLTVMSPENKRGMPKLIEQLLIDSSLLFLGYGLEDWDFRTIYKGLIERLPRQQQWMSFAIQKGPTPFWAEFWDEKHVRIYDYDLDRFAVELRRRFGISE